MGQSRLLEWPKIRRLSVLTLVFLFWTTAGYAEEPEIDDMGLPTSCVECHEETYQSMSATRHAGIGSESDKGADATCIRCHGPDIEHAVSKQSLSKVIAFSQAAAQAARLGNDVCLECHKEQELFQWYGSVHDSQDNSCAGCHVIHGNDRVMEKREQAAVCYRCHQEVRGQFLKPYNHPVREEKLTCSDCHQPHGGRGPSDLNAFTVTESCTNCHPEQRGPFLWEHQPVSESCTLCHNAHGSIERGMLLGRGPHLCQLCHQATSELRARHSRLALGYSDPYSGAPGPGGGAEGTARFVLSRNCMNCHVQVHGSNHPSGAMLQR